MEENFFVLWKRTSTYVYVLHHVKHVIQLPIGPHGNNPEQDMVEVSLLKNSDRQSMETT